MKKNIYAIWKSSTDDSMIYRKHFYENISSFTLHNLLKKLYIYKWTHFDDQKIFADLSTILPMNPTLNKLKAEEKSDTNNMIRWNAKQKPWRNPDLDIFHVAIPMFYIWYLKNSITRQRNHCAWADYIPKIHTHRCTDKCTTYIYTYCTYHLYVRITSKYIFPSLCHICAR